MALSAAGRPPEFLLDTDQVRALAVVDGPVDLFCGLEAEVPELTGDPTHVTGDPAHGFVATASTSARCS